MIPKVHSRTNIEIRTLTMRKRSRDVALQAVWESGEYRLGLHRRVRLQKRRRVDGGTSEVGGGQGGRVGAAT